MDFESPDVEKEFPGLYASDTTKKSNESDFSDEGVHEKHSKKELLGGSKRKDKKDKKDRGYATLEGESSPDEETKSPSKTKSKSKTFKFSSKKEKREKSREKDLKEKDPDKEKKKKEKDNDKENKEEKRKDKEKLKYKLKDRKKHKHGDDSQDIAEEEPIFGVSLNLAVERSHCHDGIKLPLVVRDCIDYLEEHGMTVEGLYKVPGNKSKVQHLKKLYNQREQVNMCDYEATTAASLLILFLKELPEPVLESSEIISRFEQAASTKELAQREALLANLIDQQLSECNRVLLTWLTLHLEHVTACERNTKMNAQAIAMTLSPVLQMSHRLLLAFLLHCKALFPDVKLTKYIPPLSPGSTCLPDTPEALAVELAKQESLLLQIHMLMNAGYVNKSREEQLWEVQRMITQLKRKYKLLQKREGSMQKSIDEETIKANDDNQSQLTDSQSNQSVAAEDDSDRSKVSDTSKEVATKAHYSDESNSHLNMFEKTPTDNSKSVTVSSENIEGEKNPSQPVSDKDDNVAKVEETEKEVVEEDEVDRLREIFIYYELLNMESSLNTHVLKEKQEIERLKELLTERMLTKSKNPIDRLHSPSEAEKTAIIQLVSENQLLEKKMTTLIRSIVEEKDICVKLRVELALQQYLISQNNSNGIKQI